MQKRMPAGLDWDALRLLLAAARARSLTGAARTLKLDQSTASRRLAALERALGVRLFDRVPGGLEPTPVAVEVLPLAEAAEAQVLELLRVAAGADEALQGTVRVAVPEAMDSGVLVPALGSFYRRYPKVRLEVVAGAAVANLARREADVGLRLVRPQAGEFVALRVAWLSVGAWGTRALVAQGADRAPWVGWDDESGFRAESGWLARHVAPEQVRLRCNRLEALAAAARAGLGLALLPDAMARRAGGLTRLALPDLAPAAPLWLVAHKALLRVPRVRVVWDFLREEATRAMAG